MKKRTRFVMLVLAMVSILATLLPVSVLADTDTQAMTAAEALEQIAVDETAGIYPIEGDYSFTYWVPIGSTSLNYINSYAENVAYQVREEMTGVHIEFIHPPVGSEQESFNLMIASEEYPDIIEQVNYYTDGIDSGIADGLFIRMNELVGQYAPAYTAIVTMNAEIRKEVFTDEGNICGFGMVSSDTTENGGMETTPCIENPWTGVQWNTEYLEACNLDVPETIEDWEEAFAAFKEMDPECTPLLVWGTNNGNEGFCTTCGSVMTAFGIAPTFYQKDGEVKYGFYDERYKDYLKLMRSWYEKGYLHEDFSSMDATTAQTIYLNGKAGCFWQCGTGETLKMRNAGYKTWTGGVAPKFENGEEITWGYKNDWIRGYFTLVTTACENPEIATRWLDWGYTMDGYKVMNFGRDGETFYGWNELGEANWAELYADNGYALWDSYNSVIRLHNGCYLKSDRRSNPRRFTFNSDIEAIRLIWEAQQDDFVDRLPPITLTSDEGAESSRIMAEVEAYVDENTVAYIRGTKDIDSTFDEYMSVLKSLNIDRAIEIRQNALTRYNAR